MNAHAVETLHVLFGMAAVEPVDDVARADIRADFQRAGHVDVLVATPAPVVVLHPAAVHLDHAAACMYDVACVVWNHAVIKCHEQRSHLEHRPRLATVADGRVDGLGILTVGHAHHVDNGLYVARLHLHQDGHAEVGIYLGQLHLINEGALGQVLHIHVDGGHDVGTVDGRHLSNVHNPVEHLLAMDQPVLAAQRGVERQLQTAAGGVYLTVHDAYRSLGQRIEGVVTGVELVPVEAALAYRQVEDGQLLEQGERIVVYAVFPYRPVAGTDGAVAVHLVAPLVQIGLELADRLLGEDVVQANAEAVNLLVPKPVDPVDGSGVPGDILLTAGLEVHEHLVFGYGAGHQLTVAAQDVAAVGFHGNGVVLQLLLDSIPVVLLDSHDVESLADDGNSDNRQRQHDGEVARHDLITVELTHLRFRLKILVRVYLLYKVAAGWRAAASRGSP